jgi:hypothetical protein
MSIAGTTAAGATAEEQTRRADAVGRPLGDLRAGGFAGSAAEVADKIGTLGELGFSRIYFQLLDISDLDQLDFIARDVLPQLGR